MNTLGYLVAPTEHFALPPYSAQPSGGSNSWWFVADTAGWAKWAYQVADAMLAARDKGGAA